MEGHIILSNGRINNVYILFLPKGIYRLNVITSKILGRLFFFCKLTSQFFKLFGKVKGQE